MTILIAHPSPVLRRTIRNVLYQAGFIDILEASAADGALAMLRNSEVALTIIGTDLGTLRGTTFTEHLRSRRPYQRLPVLMVSDRRNTRDVLAAANSGVDGYILLPFQPEFLVEKVWQLLEQAMLPQVPAGAPPVPAAEPQPAFNVHRLYGPSDYGKTA